MRFRTVILLLYPILSFGQQKADSTTTAVVDEWLTKDYTQEDKIFNRSVWTFVDNPALAGFDRKLAVAYRFRVKNLKMGVPNDEGNL